MGVKDWFRRLVPFHRRNLLDDHEREQALQDAIDICRRARLKAGDPPNLVETDAVFDDLLDAYEKLGLDPAEVWWAADSVFPDNPRWLEALAARALADKSTDRVTLQILRRQSERDPENLPLLLRVIECYRAIGDEYMQAHVSSNALKLARLFTERGARSLPRGVSLDLCEALVEDLSQNLARMYLTMGREDDEALDLYVKAIERDVSQTEFLGLVSRRFMEEGRKDAKAVEVYEEALAFDLENKALKKFLGRLYLDAGRIPEGLSILRSLMQVSPADPQAREALVTFLAGHREHWGPGDLDLLITQFKTHPDNLPLLKALTEHFLSTEDLGDRAIEIYQLAVARGVEKPRGLRLLARRHAEKREWSLVVGALEQVIQLEGTCGPDVVIPLANAYSFLERTDEKVIRVYEAAVQAGSRTDRIHDALCRHLYINSRNEPNSIQQFRQTLDFFPECKWAVLGLIHENLHGRNYLLAFEEALTLLKREPGERETLLLVARALAHEPNPRFLAQLNELGEVAVRDILRQAYHEKPSAKRIALALARAEIRAGVRDVRLVPILRTALQAEPDDADIATALSESLWRAGREDEGAEVDTQILAWIPSGRLGSRMGEGAIADDRFKAGRQAAVRLSGYYARKGLTTPEALEALWKAYEMNVCADEAVVFLGRHLATTDSHGRRDQELLSRALDLQPHDSVLRMALLRAKASRGDVDEPLRWCLEQLRSSPTRRAVRDLLREVINTSRKEDLRPEMLGQLRGICSANPDDQDLAEIAARAHQVANVMNAQVRSIFERALGGRYEDPNLLQNMARSYFEAGDYTKAAEMYSALLEKNAGNEEAIENLARLFAKLHRHTPEAARLLEQARRLRPDDSDLALFHIELLFDEGEVDKAVEILEGVLRTSPDLSGQVLAVAERYRGMAEESPKGLLLLARLYIQAGEPDDALHMLDTLQSVGEVPENDLLAIYDALVVNFPENVRARMERAVLHKVAGRYDEALADFEALVEEEGPTPAILAEQAEVLHLKLEGVKEPDLDLLRKLARLHQLAGESEDAAEAYRQVLERSPEDYEARRALGRTALEMDRLDEAVDHLKSCPPHLEKALCLSDVARAYERKSQWAKAVETLKLAMETGHAASEDQIRLGRLEQRLRQEKAAQSAKSLIRELPSATQERYELLQQIAAENDEAIFRAYDRKLDEVVALKVFPQGFPPDGAMRDFFCQREEVVRNLNLPRVVRILDAGKELPRRYLVMEYLTGGDLAAKIRRVRGPLSIPEVRRLAIELAECLQSAHAAGLVHGSLGPGKILYNIDGKIKITGLVPGPSSPWFAREAEPALATSEETPFRSPQMRSGQVPTPADDMFAFGALLFQVVSGRPPDPTRPLTEESVKNEMTAAIRRAGPALSAAILRCLAPDPQERFQSVDEMMQMIKAG